MTNEQAQVKEWMRDFGQEAPDTPTIPSLEVRKLRAKLILEEALETAKALGLQVRLKVPYIDIPLVFEDMTYLDFVGRYEPNLTDILDGCEDLKVVTEGTLISCGLLKPFASLNDGCGFDPHFNEVIRSNWSKMWTDKEIEEYENNPNNPRLVIRATKQNGRWLVKDRDGKVIKSPSYSPPNFKL